MSIATEITRLQTAKSDLKTAIENKGVTVPSATLISGYASLVDQISGGGISNSDAILQVTTDVNAIVVATKGAITLSPTIWTQSDDNSLQTAIFVISPTSFDQTAWTVTSSYGSLTVSDTIVVDSAKDYELELSFRLPPQYQEVEYIQSSGTQWIDTGIKPNQNTKAQIKFINLEVTGDVIIGQSGGWRLFNYQSTCYFDLASNKRISGSSLNINTLYEFELGNFYVKNIVTGTNKVSGTTTTFTPLTTNITLNHAGNNSKNKWYYVKLFDNDTLVCDLIPCYRKSDSVAGMWDTVTRSFLTNVGTGSFIVGSDV